MMATLQQQHQAFGTLAKRFYNLGVKTKSPVFMRYSHVFGAAQQRTFNTLVSRYPGRYGGGASPEYGQTLVSLALTPVAAGYGASALMGLRLTPFVSSTGSAALGAAKIGKIARLAPWLVGAGGLAAFFLSRGQQQTINPNANQDPNQDLTQTTPQDQNLNQYPWMGGEDTTWGANSPIYRTQTQDTYSYPSQSAAPTLEGTQTPSQTTTAEGSQTQDQSWLMIILAVGALLVLGLGLGGKKEED